MLPTEAVRKHHRHEQDAQADETLGIIHIRVTMPLQRLSTTLKSGSEPLRVNDVSADITLLDFWRWSKSDLVGNTARGILAEFIVATALGIPIDQPREDWTPWDLTTPDGIKVEVKSSAYIQSWEQKKLSTISFLTPARRAWDADSNSLGEEAKRRSDVYVFALLAHKDKATIDPLNLDQWEFFVVRTTDLDARTRSQHSITLASLLRLHGPSVNYSQLKEAVSKALA